MAEVVDVAGDDLVLDVKNRFALGDELLLMSPSGNRRFQLGSLLDKNGKAIEVAPGSGHRVRLPMGEALDEQALRFGLLVKDIHSTGC